MVGEEGEVVSEIQADLVVLEVIQEVVVVYLVVNGGGEMCLPLASNGVGVVEGVEGEAEAGDGLLISLC